MKFKFKIYNPYGFLGVIKGGYILSFFLIWNILCGIGVYLNGGFGRVEKTGSMVMASLALLFTACCAFAPIKSENIRKCWCKDEADFEEARYSLWQVGIIAGGLFVASMFGLIEQIM